MHIYFRFALALASLCVTGTAVAFDPAGRVVVKFHDHTLARAQPAVALRTLAPEARPVIRLANGAQVLRVDQGGADALIARLCRQSRCAVRDARSGAATHERRRRSLVRRPIDVGGREYSRYQADLYDPVGGVNAPAAWAQGATGEGIVVAVVDTGITAHPDLDANIVEGAGYDFITDAFFSGREDDSRQPGGWDTGDWTHLPPYVEDARTPQQLARHARGGHDRRGREQRPRHRRHGASREGAAGARARPLRRLHVRHRRCDHVGVGWQCRRRARTTRRPRKC